VKKSAVNLGDRFIKVYNKKIVWVVSHFLEVDDVIPHALLVQEGASNRKITLSIPALQDASIYKKLEALPPA